MLSRQVCRHIKKARHHTTSIINPSLKSNLFSQRNLPERLIDIKFDTYPNPLLSFEKSQLLRLTPDEVSHLACLPVKSINETNQFCNNVIEIVRDNLVKDTKFAISFIALFEKTPLREMVFESMRNAFSSDKLRSSIIAFIEDPTSSACRELVQSNLTYILSQPGGFPTDSVQIALNYLKKLAVTQKVNPLPIFLDEVVSERLCKNLTHQQEQDLFASLVNTNIKFRNNSHFEKLRDSLSKASPLGGLVARTGLMDAKWHHTEKFAYTDDQKQKMILFFSLHDLARFMRESLRKKDVTDANLYLELLVTKFELLNDTSHLSLVLDAMLSHSMAFKGPKECIKFLRYIMDSNMKVSPSTLLRVLSALRKDSMNNEALLLINFLHNENLTKSQRKRLVTQTLQIICSKFSEHPKVAVGYFASLFSDDSDTALLILRDLFLLDLVYEPGSVSHSFDVIERADIHDDLKNSKFTHSDLREMYDIILGNLHSSQNTNPVLIRKLYHEYKTKLDEAKSTNDTSSVFHQNHFDESIVALLMDHLLRTNPKSRNDMELVRDNMKYEVAKSIWDDFMTRVSSKNGMKKPYILDLMISSALLKHQDVKFAIKVFKHGRAVGMQITFNQIYPFIMHHHSKGEMIQAQRWFDLLVQSGAKAKSVAAEKVFKLAKELDWPVKGTYYMNSAKWKNRANRLELDRIKTDPFSDLEGDEGHSPERKKISDFDLKNELEHVLCDLKQTRFDS